jgi:hypothetical protein
LLLMMNSIDFLSLCLSSVTSIKILFWIIGATFNQREDTAEPSHIWVKLTKQSLSSVVLLCEILLWDKCGRETRERLSSNEWSLLDANFPKGIFICCSEYLPTRHFMVLICISKEIFKKSHVSFIAFVRLIMSVMYLLRVTWRVSSEAMF